MKIAFIDTETTGLNPDIHELWEIAFQVVEYEPGVGTMESEPMSFVARPSHLERADMQALEVGRYFDRVLAEGTGSAPGWIAGYLTRYLRGARLASCNVSFDVGFLRAFMTQHGQPAIWHYSPIDIKSMCYGAWPDTLGFGTNALLDHAGLLADAEDELRHTAAHDVQIARKLFEKAMTWAS